MSSTSNTDLQGQKEKFNNVFADISQLIEKSRINVLKKS